MEEYKFHENTDESEIERIYNHIGRVIDKINKRSFNKIFNLELDDMINTTFDGFTYLIPYFLIDDSFIQINYREVEDFFMNEYSDMMIVEVDDRQEYIAVSIETNMNHEPFRNTLDLDDESFELWFKLRYGS
jgi:hypothetical protein